MKIAVDARTLGSRPSGVGMYLNDFLKVLMKYREFEFVLLSDVAESEYIRYFMEKGIPVITQGKAVYRSAGVYSYFSFIQKQLNEIQPDLFWEVNTIIPIRLKGNFKTMITIHDMFPIEYVEYFGIVYSLYFKHNLAKTLRNAFRIAKEGRPGPVLVDVTKDVTAAECEYTPRVPKPVDRITASIKEEDIDKAVTLIKKAKKPYVFVGGGAVISEASDELKKFVEKVDAPVCDSLMGKGAFDGSNERYTGMLGMHGTKTSNYGVSECDLLIVVGARFSDRVTGNTKKFAKNAKILQFDVDAAEINKNVKTDAHVLGDAKEILKRINDKLDKQDHSDWMEHIKAYKLDYPMRYNRDILNGPLIMEKIYEITNGDAIITTDVGQHQMWAAQHYKFKEPRTLLTSGGLGTMGYGLGACIGAKVGRKDKTVVNIAGDGCFRMNMNEVATATRYNIPIIEVIFNNHVLGMVRQWQDLFYGKRYSATVLDDQVDFVKVSEGMGAKAYSVDTIEEFEKAFKEAIELNIPCVIDCHIDREDKVFPMVSPGAAISEAFDREDLNNKK